MTSYKTVLTDYYMYLLKYSTSLILSSKHSSDVVVRTFFPGESVLASEILVTDQESIYYNPGIIQDYVDRRYLSKMVLPVRVELGAPDTPLTAPVLDGRNALINASWDIVERATYYDVYINTEDNTATAWGAGSGITDTSYDMGGVANNILYYVWYKAGNDKGISDFSPVASFMPLEDPRITVQPQQHVQVVVGHDQDYSVTAAGTEPLSYQWFLADGVEAPFLPIEGATNSTVIIPAAAGIQYIKVKVANIYSPIDWI